MITNRPASFNNCRSDKRSSKWLFANDIRHYSPTALSRLRGLINKPSHFGSEDSRDESWRDRRYFLRDPATNKVMFFSNTNSKLLSEVKEICLDFLTSSNGDRHKADIVRSRNVYFHHPLDHLNNGFLIVTIAIILQQ